MGEFAGIKESFSAELRFYRLLMKDRRTPAFAKYMIAAAVVYFLSPIDIIPDFIPILGQLDELLISPTLIFLALQLVPAPLAAELRARSRGQDVSPRMLT